MAVVTPVKPKSPAALLYEMRKMLMVMLANGIGVYCIGKGLYTIAITALLGRGR